MMTNTSIITTGAQFEQWARQVLHFPKMVDSRPFQTLLDTFSRDGKVLSGMPFGDMNIMSKDGKAHPYLHQTFLQVVQMAKGINTRLQRTAASSFQTMCLEEDAEELDLLAELARKNRKWAAPSPSESGCGAADETERELVALDRAIAQRESGHDLNRHQKEQLAAMAGDSVGSMDENMYTGDYDLAAMF